MRSSEANDADPSAPQVIELAPGRQTPTSAAPVELPPDEAVPCARPAHNLSGRHLSTVAAGCLLRRCRDRSADRRSLRSNAGPPAGNAVSAAMARAPRSGRCRTYRHAVRHPGGLGTALSGPAAAWVEKVPAGLPKLQQRLTFLTSPSRRFSTSSRAPRTSLRRGNRWPSRSRGTGCQIGCSAAPAV
jgi:hypothetical protein